MTQGLSVQEVADLLRVSRQYIGNLCNTGKLPNIRLGRRIIIDKADLDKWIESKKINAN